MFKSHAEIARLTGVPVRTIERILDLHGTERAARAPLAPSAEALQEKTNSELRLMLADAGIQVPARANKATLIQLITREADR
jgi:hypothetical protein